MLQRLLLASFLPLALGSAPAGPWDAFNYAPESRTVRPRAIFKTEGAVTNAEGLVGDKEFATLESGSWLTLDFGFEVGGLVSLNFDQTSSASAIAFSFTESSLYVRPDASDDSTDSAESTKYDGVLQILAPLAVGHWTQPAYALRGGFRYLTIVSTSADPVTLSNVTCTLNFMPHVESLRDYAGHFFAPDPHFEKDENFLTKLWYAGAYTVQTNTIPADTGRQEPPVPSPGWANNATAGVASPIIVDGAKRDRAVWPGDMAIAVPTAFVTTNDLIATRNSLSTMFSEQNPGTGELPYAGPPYRLTGSDTYHMWTLIGTRKYILYSGDTAWLETVWTNYTKAVDFVTRKVGDSGLMDVTGTNDWARLGGGGLSAPGNALLYKTLIDAAYLATLVNQQDLALTYATKASALKEKFNTAFWDENQGLYRDKAGSSLYAQDANSYAALYNLTNSPNQVKRISEGLKRYWDDLGPVSPEAPDTISPFISGFELQTHFEAGNDETAMDLLRREWGYMLYTGISVQSTLLEGFTANGSLGYRSDNGARHDPTYTSHAHGWSTGPTSALTFYVLGLSPTAINGSEWRYDPHTSGLPAAEGSFETPLGRFGVQWKLASDGSFDARVETPAGTTGIVKLSHVAPPAGSPNPPRVLVDGSAVVAGLTESFALEGGTHTVQIRYGEK